MILNKYKRWVFIADTHLNYKTPEKINIFIDFLKFLNDKIDVDVLFILGDFVDFWIEHKKVKLSNYYKSLNIPELHLKYDIYFIPGNRDFDIGEDFSNLTNFQIIDEEYFLINIEDKKVLLTHGDLLCRKDFRYQLFRKFIRNKYVKKVIKFFPSFIILKFIALIENISKVEKTIKKKLIQTYNYNYTEALLKKYKADYLVAGHLHEIFIKKHKNKTIISCGTLKNNTIQYITYFDNKFRKNSWEVNNGDYK